jgi:peptidoglycan/LPS O-acetylase OafA/YrhL
MRNRNGTLDAVRGIAITLVVGLHYAPGLLPSGWIGVDLFFVLSGYLIGGILLDNRDESSFFTTFYWRRAFRILPLYWLFLAVVPTTELPLYLVFGQTFGWAQAGIFPAHDDVAVTWSLAVEEQFYLLLPVLVRSLPRRWLVRMLWVCVLAAPFWRWGLSAATPLASLMMPCHLDALMGGTLVACFMRGYARSRTLWACLALVPVVTDAVMHRVAAGWYVASYSLVALICASLLLLVVTRPAQPLVLLRPLSWLGIGAYSIYLFHLPVLRLTGSPLLALPLVLALAWVFWRFAEAPLIAFARDRWRYGPRPEVTSTIAA